MVERPMTTHVGYRPVTIEIRLCEQALCCDHASVKRTPRAANASMFGVAASGLPNAPIESTHCWSVMNSTMLGRPVATATLSSRFSLRSSASREANRMPQMALCHPFPAAVRSQSPPEAAICGTFERSASRGERHQVVGVGR